MKETFTWVPLVEPVGTTKYAVRTAQFGDGYSQSVADGINNKLDAWPLTFTGNTAYIAPIKAFLDSLQGYQSFYWTPPLASGPLLFRAEQCTVKPYGGGNYELNVTFQEVFS